MEFNEIRKMAKTMGINTYRMKKTNLIRAIQRAESNAECYGTEWVEKCHQDVCSWRENCMCLNLNGKTCS